MTHLVTNGQPNQPDQPTNEAARYMREWGEQGAVWYAQGLTWTEAKQRYAQGLQARIAQLESENQKLRAQAKNRIGAREMLSAAQAFEKEHSQPTPSRRPALSGLELSAAGTKLPGKSYDD